ncbi:MAG: hypothetical protein U1C49_02410 [Candidatus Andersenbacteria bacterium]|nr:hypothetical protein [bacterium]MDZ4225680.1 hypothetical protein [Candidatus Andersenbacteria bacterium]
MEKSWQKKMPLVGLAVVILLLLAGYWLWAWQNGQKQARAVSEAFSNIARAESFHALAELKLYLPPERGNKQRPLNEVAVMVEGDVWPAENNRWELAGDLSIEARGKGTTLFTDGQVRLLPDATAFRLSTLPVLLNPSGRLADKWTYVNVPLLETANPEAVRSAFNQSVGAFEYGGRDSINGQSWWHYTGSLNKDQRQALVQAFNQKASRNRGLNVLARLLAANEVRSLDVWVDPGSVELARVKVVFARGQGGDGPDFAELTMDFSDFGKQVVAEMPSRELTVQPEVFGRMFGSGEIAPIQ